MRGARLTAGDPLNCSKGSWNRNPTSYAYRWNRTGSPIGVVYEIGLANKTLTATRKHRSFFLNSFGR